MLSSSVEIRARHYRWVIAATGVLALFCCIGLTRFAYAVLIPGMQPGLQLGYERLGVICGNCSVSDGGFAAPAMAIAATGDCYCPSRVTRAFLNATFFFASGQTIGPACAGFLRSKNVAQHLSPKLIL